MRPKCRNLDTGEYNTLSYILSFNPNSRTLIKYIERMFYINYCRNMTLSIHHRSGGDSVRILGSPRYALVQMVQNIINYNL